MFIKHKVIEQPVTNVRPIFTTTLPISAIINNRRLGLGHTILLPKEITLRILELMAANLTQTQTVQID